ncbi:MAG: response regulator transcription factor [Proteobacteria bacterium]|nr:response regulator transcription factor [Pseudomonadota bacterium]
MSGPVKVLIVDDEPQIQRFLKPSFIASGFSVASATSAKDALRAFSSSSPDVVLLDLGLPDADGKTVIEAMRRTSKVPIIVLSARDREGEKIEALDLGADDFVNKPFGIGELLARVRSALRRTSQPIQHGIGEIDINGIRIDLARHQLTRNGVQVHLTPKEFDLLAMLMRHAGRVITHRQLLQEVWGPANVADGQYLRVFIGQLRAKLEDKPAEPSLILTEPGVGYRFADPS